MEPKTAKSVTIEMPVPAKVAAVMTPETEALDKLITLRAGAKEAGDKAAVDKFTATIDALGWKIKDTGKRGVIVGRK